MKLHNKLPKNNLTKIQHQQAEKMAMSLMNQEKNKMSTNKKQTTKNQKTKP